MLLSSVFENPFQSRFFKSSARQRAILRGATCGLRAPAPNWPFSPRLIPFLVFRKRTVVGGSTCTVHQVLYCRKLVNPIESIRNPLKSGCERVGIIFEFQISLRRLMPLPNSSSQNCMPTNHTSTALAHLRAKRWLFRFFSVFSSLSIANTVHPTSCRRSCESLRAWRRSTTALRS